MAAPAPPLGSGPLNTEGGNIVDADGRVVHITGVNWFGLETGTFAPQGLWARGLNDMLDQIAQSGFNTIRLPYSDQLFDPSSMPNGIDFQKNPDLQGLSGLQIMDQVIERAGERGLKVILDRHRPDAQAQSTLWY
ncbi:MAG: cellulase family glycosylhydrolase, partial [Chloroflexi bacterium]|nr:cellulase family glycosylhydrolase [Chloroflexota bacterium]